MSTKRREEDGVRGSRLVCKDTFSLRDQIVKSRELRQRISLLLKTFMSVTSRGSELICIRLVHCRLLGGKGCYQISMIMRDTSSAFHIPGPHAGQRLHSASHLLPLLVFHIRPDHPFILYLKCLVCARHRFSVLTWSLT